uniref:Uncharacterized protein n=1 Tax=Brassica oleracea TaxID=3712 RepID=A0A3P6GFN0_BRAOL|nr:unnamed protein product [Brassica oleracea]
MRPCSADVLRAREKKKEYNETKSHYKNSGGKLLLELAESYIPRRSLATKGPDKCADSVTSNVPYVYSNHIKLVNHRLILADGLSQGKVAFLHIFIFVLAVVHVIYCNIVTYALGKSKRKTLSKKHEEVGLRWIGYPGNFKVSSSLSGGSIILQSLSGSGILGYPGVGYPSKNFINETYGFGYPD